MSAESRCGILCGQCTYREQTGCRGCMAIEKPFWGESCPVKDCCEGKKLSHCGLCPEFSCDLAHSFAYDQRQGDGGARLQNCVRWREEEAKN